MVGDVVPEGDNVEYDGPTLLIFSLAVRFLSFKNKGEFVPEENREEEGTLR